MRNAGEGAGEPIAPTTIVSPDSGRLPDPSVVDPPTVVTPRRLPAKQQVAAEALCPFPAIIPLSNSAAPQSPTVPASAPSYHLSSIVPSVLTLADCQKLPPLRVVYRSDVLTIPAATAGGYVPLTSIGLIFLGNHVLRRVPVHIACHRSTVQIYVRNRKR